MKFIMSAVFCILNIAGLFSFEVVICGDVMLGNWMNQVAYREGFAYPFKKIRPLITSADVSFCNLECPLTTSNETLVEKKYSYKADPKFVKILKSAGFDVVSLANNHILDFGYEGLFETIKLLDENNISHCGAGNNINEARKPAELNIDGKNVKFFAYSGTFPEEFWADENNPGTAFQHKKYVIEDISRNRESTDFLYISYHFGREGTDTLRNYQKMLAHTAIDNGADAVFGHHPHVLQPIEIYKGKPIFYSLGNCVFATYSKVAKESIIPKLIYDEDMNLSKIELHPINVNNYEVEFQVRLRKDRKIIDYLNEISKIFNTEIDFDEERKIGVINFKQNE